MTKNYDYQVTYNKYHVAIEKALPSYFPHDGVLQQIVEDAMEYSLMAGGKRLRGVLVLAFYEVCGGNWEKALPYACAIEMIHAYSLIHDDLPCMDNDLLRRGKPTCHIQFDEATALLAGDTLLTRAFEIVAEDTSVPSKIKCRVLAKMANCAGSRGMIGGQVIDIMSQGENIPISTLQTLHSLKTGALIRCAIAIGCLASEASETTLAVADSYGEILGLTFQIVDDILDVTSTTQILGKEIGSDKINSKTTYVTLFGIDGATEKVATLLEETKTLIQGTDIGCLFLIDVATKMANRQN